MKKLLTLLVMLVLVFAGNGFSQEQSAEDQAMMKKWMEYATPGKFHKTLEYFTGHWTAVSKHWMKPGDKAIESKDNTGSARMIMDGRYLVSVSKGSMMGMDFTGLSITGYDNLNKKFMGYWIDSTGTGFFPYEGQLDETGKIRTDMGTWDDLMTGGKYDVRMVTTIVDDNTYTFEMFMKYPNAPEYRSMEMTYSRVKCGEKKNCCGKKESDAKKKCCKKSEMKQKNKL